MDIGISTSMDLVKQMQDVSMESRDTSRNTTSTSPNITAMDVDKKVIKKVVKKVEKTVKDPNAPKRPLTAYFLFAAERRARIKAANPTITSASKIAELIGKEWATLSQEQKQPYERDSKLLKEAYQKAKEVYDNQNQKK